VPLVVPAVMRAAFPRLARRLGTCRGYLAGFAIYYATCLALAAALAERPELVRMFGVPARLPSPRPIAVATLVIPPLGGLCTQLIPRRRETDPMLMAFAVSLATVNATLEELLWHGVPVLAFGNDPIRAWLWPALGFTAWHLALMSVRTPEGPASFLLGAAMIGLGSGWVVCRSGSLTLSLVSHTATDATGIRAAAFWLGRD
jgi:membrane protease YdiL (CAAX protease family)